MTPRTKLILLAVLVAAFLPVKKTIRGQGVVISGDITIKSLFDGIVKKVDCGFGTAVKKDDPLITLLLVGAPDYDLRQALTKNNLALEELNRKYRDFDGKDKPDDLKFMELASNIRFLQHESQVLTQILGKKKEDGQISYEIKSPLDGKVHLLFPKAGEGNFVRKNDDLLILQDSGSPKQILCLLSPDQIQQVAKGDLVESVPMLNWDKGILRLTAAASDQKLNREQLESYIASQPELFDILYSSNGSRKNYWAFLAEGVKCDQLEDVPVGMLVNIDVDKGFTTPLFVLGRFFERVYFQFLDRI